MPQPRKSLIRRLLELRLLLVVNGVILVLLALSFGREFVRNFEIQRDIDRLQSQSVELSAKNLQIAQLNTAFQTESFIEREARLKLGMKKPGENVVVIQQEGDTPVENGITTDETDPLNILEDHDSEQLQVSTPTKWLYYFFDKSKFNDISNYEQR